MRYSIDQGLLYPALEIEIDGVPPCLLCGEPVARPSMGGPLICGLCDCGNNRDGSRWTTEQSKDRYAHCRATVAMYRAQAIDRHARAVRDLLARPDLGGHAVTAAFTSLVRAFDQIRRALLDAPRNADPCADDRELFDVKIKIGNLDAAPFKDAEGAQGWVSFPTTDYGQLREALRAVVGKPRPEGLRELRELVDDPRGAWSPLSRTALERLFPTLLDLLGVHEEVVRLVKEEP